MPDATSASIDIPAPPDQVLAVMTDLAAYPQWAGGIKQVEVLTEQDGRPKTARFTVDSGPVKDSYVLDYAFDIDQDGLGTMAWQLLEGGITKKLDGCYTLAAAKQGCQVTYDLAVDLALPLPGLLKRRAEKTIVDTALKDLRARVVG